LAIGRSVDRRRIIAASLRGLGAVAAAEGDFPAARAFYLENLAISHELQDRKGIAVCLEGLAAVAAGQQEYERAARLYAAGAAVREAIGAPLSPRERVEYEGQVALARAGAAQERFASAWERGRALTLEEAVREAMTDAGT